jgi:hypothetical protein
MAVPVHKFGSVAGICVALASSVASAADLNLPVATRVVSFLQPPPGGVIPAAIIYAPGNAASEAEAASIERAGPLVAGKGTLHLKRVPVSALSGLAGVRVAFVTSGLRDSQAQIAAAASRQSILTITSDLSCVQAGRCVVAISSVPRVQITVSRAASKAANIQFGSAFLMLVKEI